MRGVLAVLALGFAALAGACASTSVEERDPFYLHIAIGRWSHMVSQVADLTGHPYSSAEKKTAEDVTDEVVLARRLRQVVIGYNRQRGALCAEGRFAEIACGSPYTPPWLSDDRDRRTGVRILAQRSRNVGERVMPLWDAVCDDARARVTDEEERRIICAIE